MHDLFLAIGHAVEGTPGIALLAALAWGVLSVVLSPCHLASIPLIVAFIGGQPDVSRRRAFALSGSFALGILITIAVLGVVTASLGRLAGDIGPLGNYAVVGVLFLVGLHFLDVIPLPLPAVTHTGGERRGTWAAFVLGLVFGVALGPCTFAFMAPILTVSFRVAGAAPLYAAGLLVAYAAGHCAIIVAAGGSTETVQRYLDWDRGSGGTTRLRKVCGVLVLLAGLYLLHRTQ